MVDENEQVKEEVAAEEVAQEEMPDVPLKAMIQALLFINGEPLSKKRILEVTSKEEEEVDGVIAQMEEEYATTDSGIKLVKFKQSGEEVYQIRTKAELAPLLSKLKAGKPRRLTKPALETLSIIAYRQPIVKSDIDKIRGVDSAPTIKTLLDRKLITIIGHQASVGQPALYATTDEFLSLFSLESISDLPTLRELKDIESEPGELPLQ
jgi:segregation and condensation protein B